MKEHTPHPLALLIPPMTEKEFSDLVESIRRHGLLEPITLWHDTILDGIHREKACAKAGVEPRYKGFSGSENEALQFVIDKNIRRRHLTDSQRAMVAAAIANYTHGGDRKAGKDQAANLPLENVTQAKAAKLFEVSERTVRDAARVTEQGTPALVEAVRENKIAVSTAAAIAQAPVKEQKQIVALTNEKEIVKRAQEIKARKKEERAAARRNELSVAANKWMLDGPSQETDGIAIHNLDARQMLNVLEPGSAQLVITSPQYNCGMPYDVCDDKLPWGEYVDLLASVFMRCYEVLCDGGRIAVNVPLGMDRAPWEPFAPKIHNILYECGFTSRGWIIWDKGTVQNSTAWGSHRMFTAPALRDRCEAIIIMHKGSDTLEAPKGTWYEDAKGKFSPALRDPNYFAELTQNVWNIQPETRLSASHPAPFPLLLPQRLMHLLAPRGALVVDPFMGTGTVPLAAKLNGYCAAGFEISPAYCALAGERLAAGK